MSIIWSTRTRYREISMLTSQLRRSIFLTRMVMIKLSNWMTNSMGSSTLILKQNLFYKFLSVKLSSMLGWRSLKAMKRSILKSKKEALNRRKRRCSCRLKDLKRLEAVKMMKLIEEIYKQGLTLQFKLTKRNSKLPGNTRNSSLGSSRVIVWTHSQIWAA